MDLSQLCIITPTINSPRYKARVQNYNKFAAMCAETPATLITVECAFGDRPFEVTTADNPNHVQLRTIEELWHKENLINIGIEHALQLSNFKYIAWIDSDCFPLSVSATHWFEETWQALQHYEFVQMWEYLINFGPDNQPISAPQMSFMKTYAANGFKVPEGKNVKHTLAGNSGMVALGRPGLAWAASVESLNKIGRLPDYCILGSADWHLAHSLVGAMKSASAELKYGPYGRKLLHLQQLCDRWIKRDVGYVPLTLGHHFHGDKVDRQYGSRGQILIDANYDPDIDIKYDSQGLVQLETWEPYQIVLRDRIRAYLHSRNEDSVAMR